MYFFFMIFFCVELVKSAIVFSGSGISQPTSDETSVTITGMTNALTTTNFAFRTIGKTLWHNGLFSPPDYFAISNFRKVTATSSTTGTALLAPFTLGEDEYQELVVVTAVPKNFALSVTGVAYTLNNYPVAATKTLLNTVTFKNLASFIFGSSSKGFSKARKTSSGVRNYGGIIATRIIGLNNTAPEEPVKCRLRLNALGILNSVMLGSDVILSDSSRIDGTYQVFQTGDRYVFQRSEYQLLSIFGSIEMDVLSTDLFDCQFANGTEVETPELDIYSISSKLGNSTTTATAPKAISCPLGCTQCDKPNNCLQNSSCLFDPGSGQCMTDMICPATRPFAMTNRTDMRQQCFKELGNQILLEKLIVSTTNITIGIFINPQLYISTTINQYCMIYAEVGVFAPSSKFFFPMNYPGSFMPQLASLNSRIIYKFMNYAYNPIYPFAPKKIMAVEVSPPVSEFRMVVRNLTSLRNNPLGWNAFLQSPELLYDAQEFSAVNEFYVEKGNHYLIELYITYQATDRLAIRMPASQALLYINGNLSVLAVKDNVLGINPNQCTVRAACFLHIGFAADSNGVFAIDQSLLSGFTTPLLREIKQIVFDSDPYCPPDSFIGSNPYSCECQSGYYANTTLVKCLDCNQMCLTCNGGTEKNCTSCSDPFILVNGECVCEAGMRREGSVCVPIIIDPGNPGGNNTNCSDPFILVNGECVCKTGMQREGSTCVPIIIDPGNPGGNKTNCSDPFILMNGECVCKTGMQREGSTCVPIIIDPGNPGGNKTNCSDPFILMNGECICKSGMQREGATCVPIIIDPGNPGNNNTNCSDPFVLVNGECVCENGMRREGSTCVPIIIDPGNPGGNNTNCSDPFILVNGECVCKTGMQREGSTCVPIIIDPGNPGNNNTNCSDPFVLVNGECVCKTGMQREGSTCVPIIIDPGNPGNNNTNGTGPNPGNPGNNQTNNTNNNQTNPNHPKPDSPHVMISQSFEQPWIKIIYLFFYGTSIIIVILSWKRYLKEKRREEKQNILAKDISEKSDFIDKLLKTFLDYSPFVVLIQSKLCPSKKFHCVFHFLLFLNIKLFGGALVTSALIKGTPFIAPEEVSRKYFLIIGAEIGVSLLLEMVYSITLRLFARFRVSIIVLAGVSSAIMVLVTERKVLEKLNNISGFILICFFIVSILIHYIWIDGLLAIGTQYSTSIQKVRKLNIYRIQPNNRAKALKIASMPSLAIFDLDETTKRDRSQIQSFKRFEINNMTSSSVINQ